MNCFPVTIGGGGGQDDDWLIQDNYDGAGSNRVTSSRDVLIEGNLTVIGQTVQSQTTIETDNLVVEDAFIHIGSGSGNGVSSKIGGKGISFETNALGSGSTLFLTTTEPGPSYGEGGYVTNPSNGDVQSLAFYSGSFDPYGNNNGSMDGTTTQLPGS